MRHEQQEHPHPSYTLTSMIPKHVGHYKLGNYKGAFYIGLTVKPIWLHRKMMKWCLGWEWVDTEET